jgi:hypothetical protein
MVITPFLLLFLFVLSFGGRKLFLERWLPLVFVLSAIVVFLYDGLFIYAQYQAWAENALTKFLLPEYQPGYFSFYVFFRVLASDIVALMMALILLFLLKRMNQRADYVFFEKNEPYLAATALFITGFPGLLLYLVSLLVVYLFWHLWTVKITGRKKERLPLYSLWPLIGVVTILMNEYWLDNTIWWAKLIFSR